MSDACAPARKDPRVQRIRLLEGGPPLTPESGLSAPTLSDPLIKKKTPKGGKKDRGKGKKGKKARAGTDDAAPGSETGASRPPKKVKATKWLAAQVQGLAGALEGLRARLSDLHAFALGHAESTASLGRRIQDLDGRIVAGCEEGGRLAGRLDELTRSLHTREVQAVAELSPGKAIEDLLGRIARAESGLERLRDQVVTPGAAGRVPGEQEGRLTALQILLEGQGARLERVERELRLVQAQAQTQSDDGAWSERLDVLERGLGGRLRGLEEGLRETRVRALDAAKTSRAWSRSGLVRLARRQAWALGLAGFLAAGLMVALWWWVDHLTAGSLARIEVLEKRPAVQTQLERGLPRRQDQDLLERLGRLESAHSKMSQDLAVVRQVVEGGDGPLAELEAGQGALARDLERLRRDLTATAEGLAVLEERLSGSGRATPLAPRPSDSPPLQGPTYAVQLVAYHGRDRIAPFVEQHGLGDRAWVTETRVGGRQTYAVLLGPYGSRAQAGQAIGALAPGLRDLGPWVRRLASGTELQPWR